MELGWRRYNTNYVSEADYFEMVLKKTCWLATIYPIRIGALIGSRGAVDLEPFVRFGFFLGAAFQIQDDLLNLVADAAYGKERDGDLWEGKRTLMLIHALREATVDERARLEAIMQSERERRSCEDVGWMRSLIDRYQSCEYARQIAQGLAGAAAHEFSLLGAALPDSRDKRFLEHMPTWVIERT
jgi:geranylgeranyl diphosphate synthase, type II